MTTHGLRVTHGPYRGDIVTLGDNRSWESADQCACPSDSECPHDCTCGGAA